MDLLRILGLVVVALVVLSVVLFAAHVVASLLAFLGELVILALIGAGLWWLVKHRH
jgi:hypothetical protein